jgi:hypothetical protein
MPATPGHQSVIRYVAETTPGTTPTNPALKLFSKETLAVRFGKDKNLQESWDLADVDPEEFFSVQNSYSLEVECHVYDVTRLLAFAARTADGNKASYTMEILTDEDAAVKHYWRGTGWVAKSVKFASGPNKPYTATIVFVGGKWADPVTTAPSIGSGSRELKSAISQPLRTFASGAVTLDAAPWAVLLGDYEFTIDDNVQAHWTTGSADPVPSGLTVGERRITGTASISGDDGFSAAWARVSGGAASTLVIPFGAAGQPKVTFTGVVFPKFDGELAVGQDILMVDQEFRAKAYAEGTV